MTLPFPSDVVLQSSSAWISVVSIHHRDEPEHHTTDSSGTLLNPTSYSAPLCAPSKSKNTHIRVDFAQPWETPPGSARFKSSAASTPKMSRKGLKTLRECLRAAQSFTAQSVQPTGRMCGGTEPANSRPSVNERRTGRLTSCSERQMQHTTIPQWQVVCEATHIGDRWMNEGQSSRCNGSSSMMQVSRSQVLTDLTADWKHTAAFLCFYARWALLVLSFPYKRSIAAKIGFFLYFQRFSRHHSRPSWPHLVILRKDVVHVCNILAGDLLDDQRAVVGVEEETLSLVICTPYWGAAGQRDLDIMKQV